MKTAASPEDWHKEIVQKLRDREAHQQRDAESKWTPEQRTTIFFAKLKEQLSDEVNVLNRVAGGSIANFRSLGPDEAEQLHILMHGATGGIIKLDRRSMTISVAVAANFAQGTETLLFHLSPEPSLPTGMGAHHKAPEHRDLHPVDTLMDFKALARVILTFVSRN
jgi:hypothetical protein